MYRLIIFAFVLSLLSINVIGQDSPSPILFIYDASGSMWGKMENKTKIQIAGEVLKSIVTSMDSKQEVGFLAYGHRKRSDCDDVEFLIGLNNLSKEKIVYAVDNIKPVGRTPLAKSASMALESLIETKKHATIILITDGVESCDGDICDVIRKAKSAGIEFRLHIVGFGLKNENIDQLKCAAREGEGNYYDAQDSESLTQVLNEAIDKTVDDPTPNFSVYATKNGLPVDAWVRASREGTSEDIDVSRSYQDTAFLFLPPGIYKIDITPLEGSDIPGTSIMVEMKQEAFVHRDISFGGGKIILATTNNGEPCDAIAKVYLQTDKKVAGSVRTYGRAKGVEVAPGNYFLTIEALQIEGVDIKIEIKDVKVIGGESQEINYNFLSGIAMVGVQTSSGELIDATINFIEVSTGNRVAGSRSYTSASRNPSKFILNPGVYNVKVVTLGKHKGNSESFTIEVKEGETVEKILTF